VRGSLRSFRSDLDMPRKRTLGYLLVGLIAVTVLALSVAEVSARISRRRAERLLHDLRQLQVGESTFEDARAVILKYGGEAETDDHSACSRAHCKFWVELRHDLPLIRVWFRFVHNMSYERMFRIVQVFPGLGLQDWWTGASVTVVGGTVKDVLYNVGVRGSGDWASGRDWVLGRSVCEFAALPAYLQERMGQRSYSVRHYVITTLGGGEGIQSILTPHANAEERRRAYDFDFACLTKVGGCTSLCQFAPSAFADLVKEIHHLPELDRSDPNCAKFEPLKGNPNSAAHP
jgi:hypothetical protein